MLTLKQKAEGATEEDGLPDLDAADYEAFKRGSMVQRFGLLLIPRVGFLETIATHDLLDIKAHPRGLAIGLICYHKAVILTGGHLLEGFFDMQNKKCALAREYDPARWPPPDPSLPIIRKMKFFISAKSAEFNEAFTAAATVRLVS
jgi:hypothetical protein